MKNELIRMMNVDEWTLIVLSFVGGFFAGILAAALMMEAFT